MNQALIPRELDILRVLKCSMVEIWEVSFLISCFPLIRKNITTIKKLREDISREGFEEATKKLDYFKLNNSIDKMKYCADLLLKFITNEEMPTKIDLNI